MLSQHVHSFWHTKKSGSFGFFWSTFVGLFANSLLKPIPCEVRPQEVGLCESLKLGHTESSSRHWHHALFPLGEQGLGTGVWAQEECYSHQDRVVERLSCHMAALVKLKGQSPPWARAEVETGAHAHCLQRAELGVPDRGPWGKRMETEGPRPNWHRATHIPAKPAAFIFSSLS